MKIGKVNWKQIFILADEKSKVTWVIKQNHKLARNMQERLTGTGTNTEGENLYCALYIHEDKIHLHFCFVFLSAFYLYVLSCTLRVVHINSVHVPHFCLISDRHCSYFAGSGVRGAWYLHGGISGKRSAGTFLSRTTKKWQFKFAAVRMESCVETISQSKEHD